MKVIRIVSANACFIHFSLKDISEFQIDSRAFSRKTDVNAIEDFFCRVKAESEARCRVHVAHAEIAYFGCHLAGIGKQRDIQGGESLPPVLRVDDNQILVSEAEVCETAQVFGTPRVGSM